MVTVTRWSIGMANRYEGHNMEKKNKIFHKGSGLYLLVEAVDIIYFWCTHSYSFKCEEDYLIHCAKKVTIHQVTAMLATSKNVLFSGHNHLLTTSTDDLTLWLSAERVKSEVWANEGSSVLVVSRWLWPGNRTFLEVASMVVTWWMVAGFAQCYRTEDCFC